MRGQLSIQHVIVEKGGEGEEGEGEGRRDLRVEERGDDRVEAEGVLELEGPDGFGGGVGSRGRSSEKSDKRNNESDTKHIRDDRDRCHVNDVMMMSAAMTVQMMTMTITITMTYDVGFMAVAAWQWREKAKGCQKHSSLVAVLVCCARL